MPSKTNATLRARRRFLQSTAAFGLLQGFRGIAPGYAQSAPAPDGEIRVGGANVAELVIARAPFGFGGRHGTAVTINGTIPGPLLRFREGEKATLRVTNRLDEVSSVHWHGILIPSAMDGVPGVSFPGIQPGETFTYQFPVRQSGTYWYHSHSSLQEQQGMYGPLVIEPMKPDPVAFDREFVVVLSDWTFRDPRRVLEVVKKQSGYFNFQQLTVGDFFREAKANGFKQTFKERAMWGRMRMDPTDILDVTGATYTYLVNGLPPDGNWTGLFRPGERVRLRFINSAAGTFFNVRIPGLEMTVVQADGQNVQPVTIDEFQIGIAETYDVIVQPKDDAYTVFAEAMDRSGYARGTLAPRAGMLAAVPALRARPLRTMVDMGMDMDMEKMDMKMGSSGHGEQMKPMAGMAQSEPAKSMAGMDHGGMPMKGMPGMTHSDTGMKPMPGMESPINGEHGPDHHGAGSQMVAMVQRNRLGERGTGLEHVEHRVLVYNDLKALEPSRDPRPHEREIEIHLTGNMEAFIWGMDGLKFSEAVQPRLRVGERVRLTMVNDTMMEHPMHLHGVFMELDNGAGLTHKPRKHTINVKAAERVSLDLTYDEPGNFAFHCHVLYHMEMGMFRFMNVSGQPHRKLT